MVPAIWVVGVAATPATAAPTTIYVAASGIAGNPGRDCNTAAFSTVTSAVAAASSGDTLIVVINKPLHLIGQDVTIDAAGLENAMQIVSSNVAVNGFTLVNANGEGLLAGVDSEADFHLLPQPVLTNITIFYVKALNNDKGFNGTEMGNCKYPGDCGGGIHFNGIENSKIQLSVADGNADGILLTDDYAPTAHNLIERNAVSDNTTECGIVLAGHNSNAVSFVTNANGTMTATGRNPDVAGLYDNAIRFNITVRNGTATPPPEFGSGGSGSGIGIFGSGPGTGAYDNIVESNYMQGNGLAGFTIHAHHPGGEDVNGNQVINNVFDTNNVGGDPFDGGVKDFETTGIAVYAVPPTAMTISGNVIRNNAIGVWLTNTVSASGLETNSFQSVTTPVVVQPAS
jgi:nitrous oxidase accessory protein NosD